MSTPKGRDRSVSVSGDPTWKAAVLGYLPPRGGDEGGGRQRSGSAPESGRPRGKVVTTPPPKVTVPDTQDDDDDGGDEDPQAGMKETFESKQEALNTALQKMDPIVGNADPNSLPPGRFRDVATSYPKSKQDMATAVQGGDYQKAIQNQSYLIRGAEVMIRMGANELEQQWQGVKKRSDDLAGRVDGKAYAGLKNEVGVYKVAKKDAETKMAGPATLAQYGAAQAAVQTLDDAIKTLSAAAVNGLLTTAKNDKKAKMSDLRAKAEQFVQDDPTALEGLAGQVGGPELLDALVKDLGGKAKSQQSKDFVAAALKARFKLTELSGDLTTKALPRLYKVMGMVPPGHTTGNDRLKKVNRKRVLEGALQFDFHDMEEASDYTPSEDKINLNLPRTGGLIGFGVDTATSVRPKWKIRTGKGKMQVSHFDRTTLHEIGHAVDEKEGYMNANQAKGNHGGWTKIGPSTLLQIMRQDKGFYEDFPSYTHRFLDAYLQAVLDKEDPVAKAQPVWNEDKAYAATVPTAVELLGDPGVTQAEEARVQFEAAMWDEAKGVTENAVGQAKNDAYNKIGLKGTKKHPAYHTIDAILNKHYPIDKAVAEVRVGLEAIAGAGADPDWDALAKHDAIDWIKHVRLKGEDDGLWDEGNGAADKYAVGGTVYQEAYGGDWWAYAKSARGSLVSNYQFRAPGEWFSEAYAAYYLGKLPSSHPIAVWLKPQDPPKKK